MRVLFLSTYFRPDVASTGVLMTQLAEELAQMGHRITVITSMPHYDTNAIWPAYRRRLWVREQQGPINVYRVYLYVPSRKGSLLGRLLNYASFNTLSTLVAFLVGRHDVVFVPSPPLTNGIAGFLIGRLRGVPFVYNVQDIYPDVAIRLGVLTHRRVIASFKALERFIYRKATAVSVISEGFRRNLLSKDVPGSKVRVIPNFVDTEFISPLPRHNRFSAAQQLDDRFVVLFAGNVGLSQGLESVLEAAGLLAEFHDILFFIVGNGTSKARLVELVAQRDLANVRFLPFQPHEVVPEMYASSDLCLVPLRRGLTEESVPSKVYTILAAGKPLVASVDCDSDTWQLVQEAECGVCVEAELPGELAEAVLAFYRDRALAVRMGERGRRFVEANHTRQRIAEQYAVLFSQVAAGAVRG